jgi:hypothetical protein
LRRRLAQLAGSLILAVSLAACGGDDDENGLAALAPPDAPLFVEVSIEPEGEQSTAVLDLVARVSGIEDPLAALRSELDAELSGWGSELTFTEDVEPWLGDRAGVFVRTFEPSEVARGAPDFGLVLEVDDAGAARDFVDRIAGDDNWSPESRSYGGFDYLFDPEDGGAVGLVDDRLVVATESSFIVAADATEGESLAESEEYRERTELLEAERFATVFIDPAAAIEAAIAAGEIERSDRRMLQPLLGGMLSSTVAAGVIGGEDSLSVEVAAIVADADADEFESESPLIESLPAGSWLAIAAPQLGTMLSRVLDQVEHGGLPGARGIRARVRARTGIDLDGDLVDWLGGAAFFVEGTGVPGVTAGLIAETTDVEGPRRLLERAREAAERDSGLTSSGPPDGAVYGFSIGIPSLGGGAEAGVVDGRLVAVFGGTVSQTLEAEQTLADDSRFTEAADALGDDVEPGFYLDLPSLFDVAESGGAADDPSYVAARPYLERLGSLLGGTRVEGSQALSRWTLTVR